MRGRGRGNGADGGDARGSNETAKGEVEKVYKSRPLAIRLRAVGEEGGDRLYAFSEPRMT